MADWADDAAALVLDELRTRIGLGPVLEQIRGETPMIWTEIADKVADIIRDEAP